MIIGHRLTQTATDIPSHRAHRVTELYWI